MTSSTSIGTSRRDHLSSKDQEAGSKITLSNIQQKTST